MSYFLLFYGKAQKYIHYDILDPIKLRNKIESKNFFLNQKQNQFISTVTNNNNFAYNNSNINNIDLEKQSNLKTVISDSYKFDKISKVNVNLNYSSFSFPLKEELKEVMDQIKSQKLKFYVEIAVEKINQVMQEHYYIVRRFFLVKFILILDTIAILTGIINMHTGANSEDMQYLGKLFFGLGFFILFVSWVGCLILWYFELLGVQNQLKAILGKVNSEKLGFTFFIKRKFICYFYIQMKVEAFLYIYDFQNYIDASQFNDSIDNEDHLYEDENLTIFTEDSYVEIQDDEKRIPQNLLYLEVNPKKREKIKALQQQLMKLKFANHRLEISIRSRKGKKEENIFQQIYQKKKEEEQKIQRQLEELQIDDSDSSQFWSFSEESGDIDEVHHRPLTPQPVQQKTNSMIQYNKNLPKINDLKQNNLQQNNSQSQCNKSNNLNYSGGHQLKIGPHVNKNQMNSNRKQYFQFIVPSQGQNGDI